VVGDPGAGGPAPLAARRAAVVDGERLGDRGRIRCLGAAHVLRGELAQPLEPLLGRQLGQPAVGGEPLLLLGRQRPDGLVELVECIGDRIGGTLGLAGRRRRVSSSPSLVVVGRGRGGRGGRGGHGRPGVRFVRGRGTGVRCAAIGGSPARLLRRRVAVSAAPAEHRAAVMPPPTTAIAPARSTGSSSSSASIRG